MSAMATANNRRYAFRHARLTAGIQGRQVRDCPGPSSQVEQCAMIQISDRAAPAMPAAHSPWFTALGGVIG